MTVAPGELAAALADRDALKIVLTGGAHTATIAINRAIELTSDGGHLAGALRIRANDVRVVGLSVRGGIDVLDATGVHLERVEAPTITIKTSTAVIIGAKIDARDSDKRGLMIDASNVAASKVTVTKSRIAQVQVRDGGLLTLTDSTVTGGRGSGIVVVGARLRADGISVGGASAIGMVLSRSDSIITNSKLLPSFEITLGIQGGTVVLRDTEVGPSARGAINVSRYLQNSPEVTITGGVIQHGEQTGVAIGQGRVKIRGTRFLGRAGGGSGDAITATSRAAFVDIADVNINRPAGYGVALYEDAGGTVSATIAHPNLGGIVAENTATHAIEIKNSHISGCVSGGGIVLLDAIDVKVTDVHIERCAGGGIVAGQGSKVEVVGAMLIDNSRYGVGVFGEAELKLSQSKLRSATWSTYVTCAAGGRLVDGGGNELDGRETRCP